MGDKWLTKEESYRLISKAQQGDEESKEILFNGYKKLIYRTVNRMKPGNNKEEFFQIGCIGFLKSIKDFKPEFDVSFTTFLVPKVRGEILRYLRDGLIATNILRFSREVKTICYQIRRNSDENGKSLDENIELLNLPSNIKDEVLQQLMLNASLQSPIQVDGEGKNERTLEEIISLGNSENEIEQSILMMDLQNILTEQEKIIFDLRFNKDLRQREIGKYLGVSQAHASRQLRKMLDKIEHYLVETSNFTPREKDIRRRSDTRSGSALKDLIPEEEDELRKTKVRQAAYILKTYQNLKQKEVALILGVSQAAVSTYIKEIKRNEFMELDSSIEDLVQIYIKKSNKPSVSSPIKVTKIKDLPDVEKDKYVKKEDEPVPEPAIFNPEPVMLKPIEVETKHIVMDSNFTFTGDGVIVKSLSEQYLSNVLGLVDINSIVKVEIKIDII